MNYTSLAWQGLGAALVALAWLTGLTGQLHLAVAVPVLVLYVVGVVLATTGRTGEAEVLAQELVYAGLLGTVGGLIVGYSGLIGTPIGPATAGALMGKMFEGLFISLHSTFLGVATSRWLRWTIYFAKAGR